MPAAVMARKMMPERKTAPRAGAEVHHPLRHPRLFKHLHKFGRNRRRVARGLQNHRIPGHHRRRRHPRHNRKRKIPRRNHRTHAQRNIKQLIALAGILNRRRCRVQPQRLAPVKLKKIDGLAHVRIGFGPVLAHLVREPRHEFELALPDDLRRVQNQRNPPSRLDSAPNLKSPERRSHGCFRVCRVRLLVHAHHLRRLRGIE